MTQLSTLSLTLVTVPCDHCTAECCRYIALPLEKPKTRRDFDDIRWYLMHEGIQVFVEEGDWYIQFRTRCRNLQPDNRCGIYESRPKICREYKPGDCDYTPGDYDYDELFTHPRQIEEFAERFARQRRARAARRRAGKRVQVATAPGGGEARP